MAPEPLPFCNTLAAPSEAPSHSRDLAELAICMPDALHHHLRVGLGYLTYHSAQPVP